jgi:hypothetical protein
VVPFLIAAFLVIAAIPAVFIYDGLVTGEVQTRAWAYRRSEEPVHFWLMIALYAGVIVWLAYFLVSWALEFT